MNTTSKIYGVLINICILVLIWLGDGIQLYVDAFEATSGWGKALLILLGFALLFRLLVYIFGVTINGFCHPIIFILGLGLLVIMLIFSRVVGQVMFGSLLMTISTVALIISDAVFLYFFCKD